MERKIFYKVDWLSVIVEHSSVKDFLECIFAGHYNEDFSSVFLSHYVNSTTMGTTVNMTSDCFLLQVPRDSVVESFSTFDLDVIDPESFGETIFSKFRVDFSGKNLDNLRSFGVDIEDFVLGGTSILPHGEYHFTRIDHAFDLIDYKPEFLDDCIAWCQEKNTGGPSPRVCAAGTAGGYKFSIRTGDQKTLYVGSVGGDKLLRIYDKKLQYMQANKFISDCPYGDPDDRPSSWIRIEWQTRRDLAGSIAYCCKSGFEVLRKVFDYYAFRESGRNMPTADFWIALYDWQTIRVIIQNANFV